MNVKMKLGICLAAAYLPALALADTAVRKQYLDIKSDIVSLRDGYQSKREFGKARRFRALCLSLYGEGQSAHAAMNMALYNNDFSAVKKSLPAAFQANEDIELSGCDSAESIERINKQLRGIQSGLAKYESDFKLSHLTKEG